MSAIPARIAALAKSANGEALAYREYDDGSIVIVFTDGRKLKFEKESEQELSVVGSDAPPPAPLSPKPQAAKKKGK